MREGEDEGENRSTEVSTPGQGHTHTHLNTGSYSIIHYISGQAVMAVRHRGQSCNKLIISNVMFPQRHTGGVIMLSTTKLPF